MAQAKLQAVLDRELASTDTAASFEAWRRERDSLVSEVERLTKLIERLEAAANDEAVNAQQAALRKRVDAQRQANETSAGRIREEGGTAIEALLKLAHDIAAAEIADAELNAQIRDDADRIVGADMLARYRPPAPRENIAETEIDLWVFASNGSLVGSQDEVIERDDGTGYLITSTQYRANCVKRRFKSIEFLEAEPRQYFEPFYAELRLPSLDGPAWSPRKGASPAAVLEALARRSESPERQVLTELVPMDAWTGAAA
ncbi:hypothetical protein CQ12_05545 [Bradyrhizobium jicamae]|uniref:Uncharacterized protein n=1 Tax=Bradyrhizobium jicamae TaxID=280332 RepID=A0A0R3LU88_9BRAD|nr:hypothetical protein [Bradyrhizobium jicamae]KRR11291.1 hypothetical protein CQ12_05545 [Bradyrhizobium jicamae]